MPVFEKSVPGTGRMAPPVTTLEVRFPTCRSHGDALACIVSPPSRPSATRVCAPMQTSDERRDARCVAELGGALYGRRGKREVPYKSLPAAEIT